MKKTCNISRHSRPTVENPLAIHHKLTKSKKPEIAGNPNWKTVSKTRLFGDL